MVGPSGLEPPTSCLSGTRSNHLSYEPISGDGPVAIFAIALLSHSPYHECFALALFLKDLCGLLFLSAPVPQPVGGDDGIRTHDPLLAGQVLSQLSYTPIFEVMGNSEE